MIIERPFEEFEGIKINKNGLWHEWTINAVDFCYKIIISNFCSNFEKKNQLLHQTNYGHTNGIEWICSPDVQFQWKWIWENFEQKSIEQMGLLRQQCWLNIVELTVLPGQFALNTFSNPDIHPNW